MSFIKDLQAFNNSIGHGLTKKKTSGCLLSAFPTWYLSPNTNYSNRERLRMRTKKNLICQLVKLISKICRRFGQTKRKLSRKLSKLLEPKTIKEQDHPIAIGMILLLSPRINPYTIKIWLIIEITNGSHGTNTWWVNSFFTHQ